MNSKAMLRLLENLGWSPSKTIKSDDQNIVFYQKPSSQMVVKVDFENTLIECTLNGLLWRKLDYTRNSDKHLTNILSN